MTRTTVTVHPAPPGTCATAPTTTAAAPAATADGHHGGTR